MRMLKEKFDEKFARVTRSTDDTDFHKRKGFNQEEMTIDNGRSQRFAAKKVKFARRSSADQQKSRLDKKAAWKINGVSQNQRFENWKRLRAPGWPAFLRSFSRGSRFRCPAFLSAGRSSAFSFWRARAMP